MSQEETLRNASICFKMFVEKENTVCNNFILFCFIGSKHAEGYHCPYKAWNINERMRTMLNSSVAFWQVAAGTYVRASRKFLCEQRIFDPCRQNK